MNLSMELRSFRGEELLESVNKKFTCSNPEVNEQKNKTKEENKKLVLDVFGDEWIRKPFISKETGLTMYHSERALNSLITDKLIKSKMVSYSNGQALTYALMSVESEPFDCCVNFDAILLNGLQEFKEVDNYKTIKQLMEIFNSTYYIVSQSLKRLHAEKKISRKRITNQKSGHYKFGRLNKGLNHE
jgi:predicted DNA-binding ArsR family transcriptional regulator